MAVLGFFAKGLIMKRAIVAIAVVLAALGGGAYAKTIYVDGRATGANNGTCWADAYVFLQDALADADQSGKPVYVRVGQGVYQPDRSAAEPNGTGDRMTTFRLINGVTIQGGYAGLGHIEPNTRDIELYETILSGDLKGDDANVANPEDLLREVTRSDNSFSVILAIDINGSAVLDGLTVSGGNDPAVCRSGPCAGGAGLRNLRASPTIQRCTFTANAAGAGGGICNYEESSPIISNCSFTRNSGTGGGIYGGQPVVRGCSFLGNYGWGGGAVAFCNGPISQCEFVGNVAEKSGGAIAGYSGVISDCVFSFNLAGKQGGVMDAEYEDTPTLRNCILTGNSAEERGGAVVIHYDSTVTIANCTFSANSATNGRAFACYSYHVEHPPSRLFITNSILFDGGDEVWTDDDSTVVVTHSNVEGGFPGDGNIDADPCFADAANDDYHLKSQGGRYDPNEGRWTTDEVTSPCIDAGDPMTPIGPEPFPNGGIVNMGAYGGTAEASNSYFGTAPCETVVAGDVNGDCTVNFNDFGIMALHWMEEH
jgi:predicted outer membrane repeat protein